MSAVILPTPRSTNRAVVKATPVFLVNGNALAPPLAATRSIYFGGTDFKSK
jgi:hypothetical protein